MPRSSVGPADAECLFIHVPSLICSSGTCSGAMQDALDRLVLLYANVCCQGSAELAELELKAELRSQLKLERCAHCLHTAGDVPHHPTLQLCLALHLVEERLPVRLTAQCSGCTATSRHSSMSAARLCGRIWWSERGRDIQPQWRTLRPA